MSDVLCSTFVLAVCDLDTSVRFYVNKLDFIEDFRVDGWAFLSRGACRLRLGRLSARPGCRRLVQRLRRPRGRGLAPARRQAVGRAGVCYRHPGWAPDRIRGNASERRTSRWIRRRIKSRGEAESMVRR
jgi:catechol 2,3-dioxygenase-like lactoylglutathione lyase family enzyme